MKLLILILTLLKNINTSKRFIFSVIISIYNTERYLDESIGSILEQSFNIKNIQIILVNDGSIDQSEKICFTYKSRYIKNIIYIKINHSGVSKARNIGIKYSKGKYINFLDSDDKWDKKAFYYAFLFFRFFKSITFFRRKNQLSSIGL